MFDERKSCGGKEQGRRKENLEKEKMGVMIIRQKRWNRIRVSERQGNNWGTSLNGQKEASRNRSVHGHNICNRAQFVLFGCFP